MGFRIVNPFFENSLPDRRKHRGNGQQYDGFLLREQPDGLYGITRAGNCESLKGEYLPMHQTGFGGEGSCIRKNKGCGERSHIPCFINERLRRIRPLGLALENSDGFLQLQIVIVVTRNGIGSQFIGQFHDDIRF